jgi:hypothetical protein
MPEPALLWSVLPAARNSDSTETLPKLYRNSTETLPFRVGLQRLLLLQRDAR